jgi:hypothetical protein
MKLVLFDLDNTLLAGDSDYEWGQFLIAKGAVDGPHYEAKNRAFYEDYKAGRLDIYAFLAFALRPLATHSREQLDAWRAEYVETRIKPMIPQAARDLVNKHLNEADLVAVITATNSFVTRPIAQGIRHPAPDRHRPRGDRRPFHRRSRRHPLLPRRQGRPPRTLPRSPRHPARQPRHQLVLQRLAQRPAAAGKGPPSGRRRPRSHPACPCRWPAAGR